MLENNIFSKNKRIKYLDKSTYEGIKEIYTYPCEDTAVCRPYIFTLPRGIFLIELYGASGGCKHQITNAQRLPNLQTISESNIFSRNGNALPKVLDSAAGAGAYARGILNLKEATQVFLHIGGKGEYSETAEPRPRGGYNGGGHGMFKEIQYVGGGGGGATDLRIGADDPWHRVMVAAGGGGGDGGTFNYVGGEDDGSGGCGGDLEGQGMWLNGVYSQEHIATQTSGFSFFQGESAQESGSKNPNGYKISSASVGDKPGAGGGWFGGFARHEINAGSGGGSSFVLHRNTEIPQGNITVYDENYQQPVSKPYAFSTDSEYCLMDPELFGGIWSGNGMARITLIGLHPNECAGMENKNQNIAVILITALFERVF